MEGQEEEELKIDDEELHMSFHSRLTYDKY